MAFHVAPVVRQRSGARRRHAPLQSAHDGRSLVGREIESRSLANPVEESSQIAVFARSWNAVGATDEIPEEGPDCLQVGDDIDCGGGDRQRHAGIGRRVRVLDDDRAAVGLDRLGASGAVAPRTSENDRDQLVPERASGGRQQAIDRRSGGGDYASLRGDLQGMVGDFDVAIGGNDIDDAGLEWLIPTDRAYRQHAAVGKDLAQVALVARIEVLGDDDRRRKVAGEGGHKGEQRVDTARRRTDDYQARKGFALRLRSLSLVESIRRVSHGTRSPPRTWQESRHHRRCNEVSPLPAGGLQRRSYKWLRAFITTAIARYGARARVMLRNSERRVRARRQGSANPATVDLRLAPADRSSPV